MLRYFELIFVKHKKKLAILFYLIMAFTFTVSIFKSIGLGFATVSDLRNRVVGARMMEDGLSPYFYHWKLGDPMRYFDVAAGWDVSAATSTPFFHLLMEPIADMPQFKITYVWCIFQYFGLFLCAFVAIYSLPVSRRINIIPIIVAITTVFTYTFGWRMSLSVGQNYVLFPIFGILSFYFMKVRPSFFSIILFAISAASLILIRPIAILIFLPFLFYLKPYFKYALATLLTLSVYFLFVICSTVQKNNWADYFKSVQAHIANHQKFDLNEPLSKSNLPETSYIKYYEGINIEGEKPVPQATLNYFKGQETSNFYVIYHSSTGKKLSVASMSCIGISICCTMVFPLYFIKKRHIGMPVCLLFILGFAVYNMYEFFTPIARFTYHWVEFIFPLLLIPICLKKIYLIPVLLLLLGVYLNFSVLLNLKMRHTVGEAFIMVALFFFIYRPLLVSYFKEKKYNEIVYLY